jgi:hypothetical protein
MQHILNYLENSKFIYKDEHRISYIQGGGKWVTEDFSWCLTISGEVFISEGGFQGQIDRDNYEKNRIQAIESGTEKNDNRLVKLTRILAIATVILAIEPLWHIASWVHRHFCH